MFAFWNFLEFFFFNIFFSRLVELPNAEHTGTEGQLYDTSYKQVTLKIVLDKKIFFYESYLNNTNSIATAKLLITLY